MKTFLIQGPWDAMDGNIMGMLDTFEDYANKTNDACDGEKKSFDAMILFTGSSAPVISLQLNLEQDGSYEALAAKLLAHEFAHLMGAFHDGEEVTNSRSNPFIGQRKFIKKKMLVSFIVMISF